MSCGIYVITNKVNGKQYVGQSVNIERRWEQHRSSLKHNRAVNRYLQYAWNKYGADNFTFSIIELCEAEQLDRLEKHWIETLDSYRRGYNLTIGGDGNHGYIATEEACRRISAALQGKKKSPKHVEIIRANWLKYLNEHGSPNAIQVVCLNNRIKYESAELAAKTYGIASGRQVLLCCYGELRHSGKLKDGTKLVWATEEAYNSMSDSDIVDRIAFADAPKIYPEDMGERISKGLKGKKKSPEHIAKMVASQQKLREANPNIFHHVPVVCLNTGETFASAVAAAKRYNIGAGGIRKCCNGELMHSGRDETGNKLVWVDEGVYAKMTLEQISFRMNQVNLPYRPTGKSLRKVVCLSTGRVYNSLAEAAYDTNSYANNIGLCCRGLQKTTNNLKWAYYDDDFSPNSNAIESAS